MKRELIVKYIVGEADKQERLLVESWAAQHSDNKKELEEMKRVWEIGAESEDIHQIDIDLAWSNFVRMRNERKTNIRSLNLPWKNYWLRLVAALLVFSTLGFWGLRSAFRVQQSLKTDMQVQHTALPDGSTVHLNTNTEMLFEKEWLAKNRKVQLLKGEVFFDVKKDQKHPFVIESGRSKITVLGTSFHVRRGNAETEVIVASGIVKVARNEQEVVLKPNQMVVISDTVKKEIHVDTVPDQLYRYYVHQEFIFENTDLQRVFDVLGKAYGKKFLIENPETKKLPYTATFEQQSLNEILEVILKTFGLKIREKDNIYYIN